MIFGFVRAARWVFVMAWICGMIAMSGHAAEEVTSTRDTLVYKDGDRVQGKLVTRINDTIVFKSDRFGELRVPAADAVVILAEKLEAPAPAPAPLPPPAPGPAAAKKAEEVAVERAEQEKFSLWERFSPSVLTAKVRNFFGPWHGRLAFSTELVSDTADRSNLALETHLQRKWEHDEVQLNGRYDYAETNRAVTTDVVKGSGLWRHDFTPKHFAQYRPTAEWNRASKRKGVPNDYVLLQQEIGVGVTFFALPTRKLRAGVSENLFDIWNTAPTADHTSKGVQSAFEESEFALPWRITISQRGVWYPVRNQPDGWENRIELNKKLTETLSTSLRHEIRRNNPDGSAQDYTRLKLLFGFDF
jgi:hypothetical protein